MRCETPGAGERSRSKDARTTIPTSPSLTEVCQPPPTLRPDHFGWETTLQAFAFQLAEGRAQDFLFQ